MYYFLATNVAGIFSILLAHDLDSVQIKAYHANCKYVNWLTAAAK